MTVCLGRFAIVSSAPVVAPIGNKNADSSGLRRVERNDVVDWGRGVVLSPPWLRNDAVTSDLDEAVSQLVTSRLVSTHNGIIPVWRDTSMSERYKAR